MNQVFLLSFFLNIFFSLQLAVLPQIKVPLNALTLDQVHFAKFSYTPNALELTRKVPLPSKSQLIENVVGSWLISDVFKEDSLERNLALVTEFLNQLNWTKITAETNNGLINIARLKIKQKDSNTALAKLIIHSDKDQIKRLSFGFSDHHIKIYFNNQFTYSGNDGFRTGDFRFLGSSGYFDDVYLPLEKRRKHFVDSSFRKSVDAVCKESLPLPRALFYQ